MPRTVRMAYSNLVQHRDSQLIVWSEQALQPRNKLKNPLLGDVWRTEPGWTVQGSGFHLDFNRGGVKGASVDVGYYATGAAMAAAVVTALEAADAVPVWACSYNAGTGKFTISSDMAFSLLFGTGLNPTISGHLDLGFTTTDKAAALSHVAENPSYQSRHVLCVDLGSAQAFSVGILAGHNLSASGTATLQADTNSLVGVGWEDTATPDFIQVLAGTDPRIAFFATQTKQHLRLIINDVQNPDGYFETGIFYVGPTVEPTTPQSVKETKTYEQLSETIMAIGGVNHHVRRPRRAVYDLQWRTNSTADVALFEALDLAMPAGRNFFISFDATDAPTTSTVYGYLREGLVEQRNDGALYVMPLVFCEALA